MKKTLLSFGLIAAIVTPTVATVACGNSGSSETELATTVSYEKQVITIKATKEGITLSEIANKVKQNAIYNRETEVKLITTNTNDAPIVIKIQNEDVADVQKIIDALKSQLPQNVPFSNNLTDDDKNLLTLHPTLSPVAPVAPSNPLIISLATSGKKWTAADIKNITENDFKVKYVISPAKDYDVVNSVTSLFFMIDRNTNTLTAPQTLPNKITITIALTSDGIDDINIKNSLALDNTTTISNTIDVEITN